MKLKTETQKRKSAKPKVIFEKINEINKPLVMLTKKEKKKRERRY